MLANRGTWCQIAGWTSRQFDNELARGFPVKSRPKTRGVDYEIDTIAGIKWIVSQATGDGKPDGPELDPNAELARLRKEQADAQSMKNTVLRQELLPAADVVAGWQAAI